MLLGRSTGETRRHIFVLVFCLCSVNTGWLFAAPTIAVCFLPRPLPAPLCRWCLTACLLPIRKHARETNACTAPLQNDALETETLRLQQLMTAETGQREEKAQGLEQRYVQRRSGLIVEMAAFSRAGFVAHSPCRCVCALQVSLVCCLFCHYLLACVVTCASSARFQRTASLCSVRART